MGARAITYEFHWEDGYWYYPSGSYDRFSERDEHLYKRHAMPNGYSVTWIKKGEGLLHFADSVLMSDRFGLD